MTVQNSTPLPAPGPPPAPRREAYQAARSSAALFDRSGEGRLLVRGADRASWLQGLLTNDVLALEAGGGCYAAYLTPQGRMLTDLRLLALADAFLMDLPASTVASIRERLDMFVITEDVTVEDVTASLARLSVHGPSAPECVARALAASGADEAAVPADKRSSEAPLVRSLAELREHSSLLMQPNPDTTAPGSLDTAPQTTLIVAGTRDLGVPGFDLYLPASRATWLAGLLRAAGAVDGDAAAWHVLRVEAGRPAFGIDMDDETIPLEAGIEDRAISFTKGCYVGQEVIIRVVHRGHGRVARRLVGLAMTALDSAPGDAALVSAGDVLVEAAGDRPVGQVTSAAFSPRLQTTIALGYVGRDFVEHGTRVVAASTDGPREMHVRPVPFE